MLCAAIAVTVALAFLGFMKWRRVRPALAALVGGRAHAFAAAEERAPAPAGGAAAGPLPKNERAPSAPASSAPPALDLAGLALREKVLYEAFGAGESDASEAVARSLADDLALLDRALRDRDQPLTDEARERILLRLEMRACLFADLHRDQVDALLVRGGR